MSIRQLPEDLINRIAAGEVVERPASVVKELVENSIDAGSRRITVTTANGGMDLIRITDDGHGMDKADLLLSVERHATSKLASDDLDDICTMGFRGEALASIGSIARLSVASRPADAESGLEIVVDNGRRSGPVPKAMNRGTVIEVKDIFANVPARRKFLKTARSETAAITDVMKRLAMANPEIHFILEGADRQTLNWPALSSEGALAGRLSQVMGADFVENAVQLASARHGVVVAGMAGLPTYTRANSLSQFYFVNGRSVKDKVLVGAVRAAFADYVFRDRFPVIALYIAIDPGEVDVNVHPAKAELRFRDQGAVRSAVINGIGAALAAAGFKASSSVADDILGAFTAPELSAPNALGDGLAAPAMPALDFGARPTNYASPGFGAGRSPAYTYAATGGSFFRKDDGRAPLNYDGKPGALSGFTAPSARVETVVAEAPPAQEFPLGTARAQMFDNYIIAQNDTGLLLVDQHAAHERLVYERFKAQMASGPVASQAQLIPVIVELPEEDCQRLEEVSEQLEKFGLYLDRFGPRAIAVRETPAILGNSDVHGLVQDLADGLAEWESTAALTDRMEEIIARMACHGSVRSGRRLRVDEMNALLRDMEATPHSGQCIHGRPTYVELKKNDIERLFGRSR
ncbi:DNA mismatch repair endonuclease MutL [Devosia sp. MC521]|uniref:DNA mismatch repair endonuclease MutL n=1 Tax=Devosia sp. MC521 TaxID=2759954 RepID=UPI0015FCEF04|nr:DNA mismatch repair endonuclease MutL [Devosia sp. MC521]MBJ6988294.1 DNA mismatch repair endonuclease MutL [Devosia sp. MC521]QMW63197.1 DNA mismatch repair endonuclease MutL [Devosia sp. MC521]